MICTNCPHKCDISEGGTGRCHARGTSDGKVICKNYGRVTSLALDPIEKKPLAMFHPGSKILSAGSYGCNMHCMWCQNDSISRGYVEADYLSPEELCDIACRKTGQGNIGLAYTYNEPSVGYEFVYDCARLVREMGMVNVMVTNGLLDPGRFDALSAHIDAYNIDLKTSDPQKYASIGGDLDVIIRNIKSASDHGCHVELTTLVVPGFNDDEDDFRRIVQVTADTDPSIPLHITRFFPAAQYTHKHPTDIKVLRHFYDMAKTELENVFMGNV
ncbi:MAG: radical SAM protein [Lachnospiraceae bacterium]|nr:radical SAM protein [Lachnospiraceae bacterium]